MALATGADAVPPRPSAVHPHGGWSQRTIVAQVAVKVMAPGAAPSAAKVVAKVAVKVMAQVAAKAKVAAVG